MRKQKVLKYTPPEGVILEIVPPKGYVINYAKSTINHIVFKNVKKVPEEQLKDPYVREYLEWGFISKGI